MVIGGQAWRHDLDGRTRCATWISPGSLAGGPVRHHAGHELCPGPRSPDAGKRRRYWSDFRVCTGARSEEHTSALQSLMRKLVCRLLLEKKKNLNKLYNIK